MRPSKGIANLVNLKIMFIGKNQIYCKCKKFNANNIQDFRLQLHINATQFKR